MVTKTGQFLEQLRNNHLRKMDSAPTRSFSQLIGLRAQSLHKQVTEKRDLQPRGTSLTSGQYRPAVYASAFFHQEVRAMLVQAGACCSSVIHP